jgi:hypothetical protein
MINMILLVKSALKRPDLENEDTKPIVAPLFSIPTTLRNNSICIMLPLKKSQSSKIREEKKRKL